MGPGEISSTPKPSKKHSWVYRFETESLLKKLFLQAAQECQDARLPCLRQGFGRQAKSLVGNGFKPFPTMHAAISLPRA